MTQVINNDWNYIENLAKEYQAEILKNYSKIEDFTSIDLKDRIRTPEQKYIESEIAERLSPYVNYVFDKMKHGGIRSKNRNIFFGNIAKDVYEEKDDLIQEGLISIIENSLPTYNENLGSISTIMAIDIAREMQRKYIEGHSIVRIPDNVYMEFAKKYNRQGYNGFNSKTKHEISTYGEGYERIYEKEISDVEHQDILRLSLLNKWSEISSQNMYGQFVDRDSQTLENRMFDEKIQPMDSLLIEEEESQIIGKYLKTNLTKEERKFVEYRITQDYSLGEMQDEFKEFDLPREELRKLEYGIIKKLKNSPKFESFRSHFKTY